MAKYRTENHIKTLGASGCTEILSSEKLLDKVEIYDSSWTSYEIKEYFLGPPPIGFYRTPPLLSNILDIIDSTITQLSLDEGTYGMGGLGWVCFTLSNKQRLLVTVWGADDWITIDKILLNNYNKIPHHPKERIVDLNWKICSASICNNQLNISATDTTDNIKHTIVISTPDKHTLIENQLRMCRCDTELWNK